MYVATNERGPDALNPLRRAGFRVWADLKMGQVAHTQLDRFLVELQLMVEARAVFWSGVSSVHGLVDTARRQRGA